MRFDVEGVRDLAGNEVEADLSEVVVVGELVFG